MSALIVYPRAYDFSDESEHWVLGVSSEGEPVKVKLDVRIEMKDPEAKPSVSVFADETNAARYCKANIDNSPTNRYGVILFTGVWKFKTTNNHKRYSASWATVLCNDENSTPPLIGPGRIDVVTESPSVAKLRQEYNLENDNKKKNVLLERMRDPRNFAYRSFVYLVAEQMYLDMSLGRMALEEQLTRLCNSVEPYLAQKGVFVRAYDASGIVIHQSELLANYVTSGGRMETSEELAGRVMDSLPDSVASVFAVPIVVITSGKLARLFYGEKSRHKRLLETFYDDGLPMLCDVAVTGTVHRQTNTQILSRYYKTSGAKYSLDELGKKLVIDSRIDSGYLIEGGEVYFKAQETFFGYLPGSLPGVTWPEPLLEKESPQVEPPSQAVDEDGLGAFIDRLRAESESTS